MWPALDALRRAKVPAAYEGDAPIDLATLVEERIAGWDDRRRRDLTSCPPGPGRTVPESV